MIVDSSAILAILFDEAEAERMARAIATAPFRGMCTVNWFETVIVAESRLGPDGGNDAQLLLRELGVTPIQFGADELSEARIAWRRFGKGRHPAALNLGDCCAYAAALLWSEPLLFKGRDFSLTDIGAVPW